MSVLSGVVDSVLSLRGAAAYALVGALVGGEAAVMLGFVLPGETAALLGEPPSDSPTRHPTRHRPRQRGVPCSATCKPRSSGCSKA
jgi:hypothetical protein